MDYPSLRWREKSSSRFELRRRRERPRWSTSLEQQRPALTSCIESCDKNLKTPQKRRSRRKGQQKPGKVSIFSNFIQSFVIFVSYFRYFVIGEQGWRSGESARLPPLWPGFDSRTRRHMWVEFVVGSRPCSEGFSPGSSVFLPPQKPTLQILIRSGNSG